MTALARCYDTLSEHLAAGTKTVPADNAGWPAWYHYVESRLAYAGCTQLAQISRVGPKGFAGPSWAPGVSGERQYPQPTARAITLMDEVHRWIFRYIHDPRGRRVVGLRTLVLPDSDPADPRYTWSWCRILAADGLCKSGPNVETLRRRWIAGVGCIVHGVAPAAALGIRRAAYCSSGVGRIGS